MENSMNNQSLRRSGVNVVEFNTNIVPTTLDGWGISPDNNYLRVFNVAPHCGNRKYDNYENGKIRYCTEKGFAQFATDLTDREKNFSDDATGMIFDESLTITNELAVNYREEEKMCGGGFGEVVRCTDEKTGCEFVRKKINRDDFNMLEAMRPKHENVVDVLGVIVKQKSILLLLDWAGENLVSFNRQNELSLLDLNNIIIIPGLEGLKHLELHAIRDLDVKPENITIKNGRLKFIDFGSAKLRCEPIPQNVGVTMYYLSPELYEFLKGSGRDSDKIGGKSDVYQFALVILRIMSKVDVMRQLTKERCKQKRLDENNENMKKEYNLMMEQKDAGALEAVERYCWKPFKQLLRNMLARSPDDRCDAKQALIQAKALDQLLRKEPLVNIRERSEEEEPPVKSSLERGLKSKAEGGEKNDKEEAADMKLPEIVQQVWNDAELLELLDKLKVPGSSEDEPSQMGSGNRPQLSELLD